jgi:Zn-dependent protease with chaperone function
MAAAASRLSCERQRLSRGVLLRALFGLFALAGLALLCFVGVFQGASNAFDALHDGSWAMVAVWLLLSLACGYAAFHCSGWLYAPPGGAHGVALSRGSARSLYRLLDRMSARLGGVHVDAVWVTGDMNAAVLQRPSWGLIGPMRTHLLIGLPLVHSISESQFSAILAHEFGHLYCQRRGWAAWGCHMRAWWYRTFDACLNDLPVLSRLPFIERWSIADVALATRLARLEELEADSVAALCVGADLVGETLVEVALKERFLIRDFWNKVMAQSHSRPRPTIRPYRDLGFGVMAGFRRPTEWTEVPMSVFADEDPGLELHPSLVDRLNALGTGPVGPRGDEKSAAQRYLLPLLPRLAWAFDRAWWADTRNTWRSSYKRARGMKQRRG